MERGKTRAQCEDLVPQAREWRNLHIDNLSSMATGIFVAHPRNLGKILEMKSSRPLPAVVSRTVVRVKETYPGPVSLEMSPTTLVVQDKLTNKSEERGRLSPITLIQSRATRIVKAPKIADLALDKNPPSELTIDNVQIFGMKVDWKQVIKDVFTALTARIQAANPELTILSRYGKRIVKNENDEQTTGFASKIIRVPQKNVILLLRNSRKDGLLRQTQRATKS